MARPAYPSFAQSLASVGLLPFDDLSRLPAYRSTYVERFHPYGLKMRGRHEDSLMNTVDSRMGLELIIEEPLSPGATVTRSEITCEEMPDPDVSSLELELPAIGGEGFPERNSGERGAQNRASTLFDALRALGRQSMFAAKNLFRRKTHK